MLHSVFVMYSQPRQSSVADVAGNTMREDSVSIIIPNTWLAKALELSGWHPQFPELYDNFTLEKADSIIEICDSLVCEIYDPCDSIIAKCNIGRDNKERLPKAFDFLDIIAQGCDMKTRKYSFEVCNNPLHKIEWYRSRREKITPLIYRYLEIFSGKFAGFILVDKDIDIGLKYNNSSNRRHAILEKLWTVRGLIVHLINQGADDDSFMKRVNQEIYQESFYDFDAEWHD